MAQVPQSLSWKVEEDPNRVAVKIIEIRRDDCKGNNSYYTLAMCQALFILLFLFF